MITRRQLMATGAVIAAAGAGAAVGAVRPVRIRRTAGVPAPAGLTRVLAREQELVASLDAAAEQDPDQHSLAAQIRDDHVAHIAALTSALAPYRDAGPSASAPSVNSPTSSRAQLRAAETSAATSAAADSLTLTGADAALLASISAAEAVHAELLA